MSIISAPLNVLGLESKVAGKIYNHLSFKNNRTCNYFRCQQLSMQMTIFILLLVAGAVAVLGKPANEGKQEDISILLKKAVFQEHLSL